MPHVTAPPVPPPPPVLSKPSNAFPNRRSKWLPNLNTRRHILAKRKRNREGDAAVAERILRQVAADCYADPVGWATFAFTWGEGPLKGMKLKRWQKRYLQQLADAILERGFDGIKAVKPIRKSIASGHGIGKSALVAIVILFIMVTRPYCKGTVTATTNAQLRTKTWAELAKWKNRCLYGHWFDMNVGSQMSIYHVEAKEEWVCNAYSCKEENSESFAGQHAADSTSFYIFDEASGVPDKISEVATGGLTDGEPWFLQFGNPTKNSGAFYETHHRERDLWQAESIDSRSVEGANEVLHNEYIERYGIDHDVTRVRVLGLFPNMGDNQLIPQATITAAQHRDLHVERWEPVVIGVDPARAGRNKSVIYVRQGKDARTHKIITFQGLESDVLAGAIANLSNTLQADAICIDAGGLGGPIADFLRRAGHPVFPIDFGGGADDKRRYRNKRTEIWCKLRDWLATGGCLPAPPTEHAQALATDLRSIECYFSVHNVAELETKDQMQERGIDSPDYGDALACTMDCKVTERDPWKYRGSAPNAPGAHESTTAGVPDYDPNAWANVD